MARDKIVLKGMAFYGYHGVKAEEKALGQRFLVDVELRVDLEKAGRSDQLEDTINYRQVYDMVRAIMEGPSRNLLERLAQDMCEGLLEDFPADEVSVVVKKIGAPIKGAFLEYAGVEFTRTKSSLPR